MSEWKQVSGSNNPTWNFEENKEIEGQLKRVQENIGPNNSKMYTIIVNGDAFGVWGATGLDRDMENVNLGDDVKIIYAGLKLNPKSNRKFKNFEVYSKPHEGVETDSSGNEVSDLPF